MPTKPGFAGVRFEELLEGKTAEQEAAASGETFSDKKWHQNEYFIRSGTKTIACRRLRKLALSTTGLIGTLPLGLGQCRGLKQLQLGGNQITGRIPEGWFEYLVNLEWLNLEDNHPAGR